MASAGQGEQKPRKEERLVDPTLLWKDQGQEATGDLQDRPVIIGDNVAVGKNIIQTGLYYDYGRIVAVALVIAALALSGGFVWANLDSILALSRFGQVLLLALLLFVLGLVAWAARSIWRGY